MRQLLDDFLNLARASWFMGAMSHRQAQELLAGQPKGTFLIRLGLGATTGDLSVSRVTDPMTVQHSRLHWKAAEACWAFKTKAPSNSNTLDDSQAPPTISPASTPRTPRVAMLSMYDMVEKRRRLKQDAEDKEKRLKWKPGTEPTKLPSDEEFRVQQLEHLGRLKQYDNAMGVSPTEMPRPLRVWVEKNAKVLGLKAACPGSPFALILNRIKSNNNTVDL